MEIVKLYYGVSQLKKQLQAMAFGCPKKNMIAVFSYGPTGSPTLDIQLVVT